MGMRQRRCPRCRKRRPFSEGTGYAAMGLAAEDAARVTSRADKTSHAWTLAPEGRICRWCTQRDAVAVGASLDVAVVQLAGKEGT